VTEAVIVRATDSRATARIREAAVQSFAELGYHGTTTRAIAGRLNMSAAALYPHYRSKEDLLFDIIARGHEDAYTAIVDADPGGEPGLRLSAIVGALAQWHAEHNLLGRVAQFELAALTAEHYRHVGRLRSRTTAVVLRIISDGAASGEFDTRDPAGANLAIFSLCVDICRWFPSRTHEAPATVGTLYADLALRIVGCRNTIPLPQATH
jgi:AcrR family transcriptional regulator